MSVLEVQRIFISYIFWFSQQSCCRRAESWDDVKIRRMILDYEDSKKDHSLKNEKNTVITCFVLSLEAVISLYLGQGENLKSSISCTALKGCQLHCPCGTPTSHFLCF